VKFQRARFPNENPESHRGAPGSSAFKAVAGFSNDSEQLGTSAADRLKRRLHRHNFQQKDATREVETRGNGFAEFARLKLQRAFAIQGNLALAAKNEGATLIALVA
jgi:hypothetical protein